MHLYTISDRVIGQGTYGEVRIAKRYPFKSNRIGRGRQATSPCSMRTGNSLHSSHVNRHEDEQDNNEEGEGQVVCAKVMCRKLVRQLDMVSIVAREIAITKELSADPKLYGRVCQLLDTQEDQNCIYMLMEYCPKGTLESIHFGDGCREPVKEGLVRRYAIQLLATLQRIHEHHGVCHRDLQLSNIVVDNSNNIRVIDFGCAAIYDRNLKSIDGPVLTLPEETDSIGNINYCAPEVVFGHLMDQDAQSGFGRLLEEKGDVWSCGVVLFQLATGFLPFSQRKMRFPGHSVTLGQLEQTYTLPDWFDEEPISDDIKYLIRRMLTVNPAQRPLFRDLAGCLTPEQHKSNSLA